MSWKIYITITGTNHYLGDEFLEKGTKVFLIKDPDNQYDHEAIRVAMEGLGNISTRFPSVFPFFILECVSKMPEAQFRHLCLHSCVDFP